VAHSNEFAGAAPVTGLAYHSANNLVESVGI